MFNTRQVARQVGQRIFGGSNPNQQILEQQIDPQAQLRLSMRERAAIAPAEALYRSRRDDAHHRVYMHRSETITRMTTKHKSPTSGSSIHPRLSEVIRGQQSITGFMHNSLYHF
ncbi:hypothetical protein C4D60_Mb03t15450 [Musa balbisiana]|uniref:Uncharacterized protein n=1 Tax=Musa balbisiana TaxID=52838 RepID=A0A4S8JCJ0_MUSBA|nr:hypothetical protein C4D60_Mb03t15450 [Musa balbisiana]